jgi:ubiquinol-cytochrome c reductase cytochrome c1 subunit
MKKTLISLLLALGITALAPVALASGDSIKPLASPHNSRDVESLQRGASVVMSYCINCHSAQYMRYNRLTAIGLTEKQIVDNFIFDKNKKIGDTMTSPLSKADAQAWLGAQPPDLSVIARSYGVDRLYSYLIGFYKDDARSTGWNNLISPNIGMPHVLAELSGSQSLKTTQFDNHDKALAAALDSKGLYRLEHAELNGKHSYSLHTLVNDPAAKQNPQQYQQTAADVTNFLAFVAEPYARDRVRIGILVLCFLTILGFIAYALNQAFWKDIH